MHAVVIPCPHCGKELKLKDRSLIGKKGKCPSCTRTFRLEEPEDPDEVQMELVQPAAPAVSAQPPGTFEGFEAPVPIPVASAGGVDRLKELRRKNRQRRNRGILIGGLMACAIAATFWYVRDVQRKQRLADLAATAKPKPQQDEQYTSEIKRLQDNDQRFSVMSPTQGGPIALNFMPAGARVIVNLHPAFLWTPGSKGEEFRYCLGTPLNNWLEAHIRTIANFEPAEIERMMICLIPGERHKPPEVAALVRLVQAPPRFEMIKKFQVGEQLNPGFKPEVYFCSGKRAIIYVDEQTFAVGPERAVQEMTDAINQNALTDIEIERLLLQTDRDRHLTMIFDPTLLRVEQEAWFPENVLPALNYGLDWVGDDIKAVAWSLHVGDRFHSQLTMRHDRATPSTTVQKKVQKRLDELPKQILSMVEMMDPREVGKRRVIGRFPAMTKVFAMATEGGIGANQEVRFNTVLDERAAPNLALGTILAWDESTRTDFNRSRTPATTVAANPRNAALTLEQKLQLKIEIDFRRTPLQDAFQFIEDESGISFFLDGDGGLKNAGITKNVPQTMTLGEVTVLEALLALLQGKGITKPEDFNGVLVLVKDPAADRFTLTSVAFATDNGMTPYVLK